VLRRAVASVALLASVVALGGTLCGCESDGRSDAKAWSSRPRANSLVRDDVYRQRRMDRSEGVAFPTGGDAEDD